MASSSGNYGPLPGSPRPRSSGLVSHGRWKFVRRLVDFRQMDFEMALHQMLYLIISPSRVYRSFKYQKNTKNQWARDDPAFLVLLAFFLTISSVCCALVFGLHFGQLLELVLWVIFVDCIGVGLIISTGLWFFSNRFLVAPAMSQYVEQTVELGYAFDVHCNAFFPVVLVLHCIQIALISVVSQPWFISVVLADTLWLLALVYYIYITFLGYSSLPFLHRTEIYLYPIAGVVVLYWVAILTRWNVSMSVFRYYGFHHNYPPLQT
ncbi:uncharacterized protein MONBRDRAFT_19514 [Monosiga brevicollis MX1]|uniref:UNC-50 family protein n=1 Tax=Monosiga brevicollis TaxID=81824 RepID=A9US01_MONBE|nr:uncharacterized protein MONBRDRAFT_19514 [Monosiga brevicollis MX1]EDQ91693.1 predicted protein [Monosiga brevicollis MX1]|eukprot:XP_001742979.1 hypothetical protein [Monosiga brevicollis MX1]